MEKNSIIYLIIIAVVLGAIYASQQPYFKKYGETTHAQIPTWEQKAWVGGSDWVQVNIMSKFK